MGNTKNQYRGGEDYLKGGVGQFEGLREGGLGKKEKVVFLGGGLIPQPNTLIHTLTMLFLSECQRCIFHLMPGA